MELSLEKFSKDKRKKDGLLSNCKNCMAERWQHYYIKNKNQPEYKKKALERSKQWILKPGNKEKKAKCDADYNARPEVKKRLAEWGKQYHSKSKNKKRRAEQCKKRYKNDTQYKLLLLLRSRLWKAVKCNFKKGSAVRDLGCTIDELKIYLEKQFIDGMSWNNWSFKVWHIDHKIPLSSFDLTDREQLLKAVHYSNLQPMWAHDNLVKHDKILQEYLT